MAKVKLTATHKKILQRSLEAVEHWKDEIQDSMRHENQEYYHAVNVKRYSADGYDIEDIAKGYAEKYRQEIIEEFDSSSQAESDRYWSWLELCWEQLEYELSDIGSITKGAKDEHEDLKYIKLMGSIRTEDYKTKCDTCHKKTWYEDGEPCHMENCKGILKAIKSPQTYDERRRVYSFGRMGGWACFQTEYDNLWEEIQETAEELKEISEREYNLRGSINNNDKTAYEDDKNTASELVEYLEENTPIFLAVIQEIEYIKKYIDRFNKGLRYEEEVKDYVSEFAEDLIISNKKSL